MYVNLYFCVHSCLAAFFLYPLQYRSPYLFTSWHLFLSSTCSFIKFLPYIPFLILHRLISLPCHLPLNSHLITILKTKKIPFSYNLTLLHPFSPHTIIPPPLLGAAPFWSKRWWHVWLSSSCSPMLAAYHAYPPSTLWRPAWSSPLTLCRHSGTPRTHSCNCHMSLRIR